MVYRKNLKNWELDKEVPSNSRSECVTIAERQGTRENENSEEKSTQSKPDSSGFFGMVSPETPYSYKIAVFDLDRTLVTCNSSYWFCAFLHRQKAFSTWSLCKAYWYCLLHKFSSKELKELHHELFHSLLKGLSMDHLKKFIDSFVRDCILGHLYFPAFQELRFAQHRGAYTVIMSSAPSFLVQQAAYAFGVDEWVATEYCLDNSQCLVGIHNFIDGQEKANALQALAKKRNVSLEQVAAYSDSYRDLPLLRLAGRPVAVNPDSKLRAISLENAWTIG